MGESGLSLIIFISQDSAVDERGGDEVRGMEDLILDNALKRLLRNRTQLLLGFLQATFEHYSIPHNHKKANPAATSAPASKSTIAVDISRSQMSICFIPAISASPG